LLDTNVNTVGDLIYILEMGDDYFLKLRGLGEKALETVKETLAAYQSAQIEAVAAADRAAAEGVTFAPDEEEAEAVPVEELAAEPLLEVEEVPVIERSMQQEDMVTTVPDIVLPEEEAEVEFDDEALDETEIAGVLDLEEVEPEVEETLTPIDDLSQTIFVEEAAPAKPDPKKKPAVVVVRPVATEESAEEEAKRKKRKGQPLVYNEELDQVVVDRKRKGGKLPEWEDEDLQGF